MGELPYYSRHYLQACLAPNAIRWCTNHKTHKLGQRPKPFGAVPRTSDDLVLCVFVWVSTPSPLNSTSLFQKTNQLSFLNFSSRLRGLCALTGCWLFRAWSRWTGSEQSPQICTCATNPLHRHRKRSKEPMELASAPHGRSEMLEICCPKVLFENVCFCKACLCSASLCSTWLRAWMFTGAHSYINRSKLYICVHLYSYKNIIQIIVFNESIMFVIFLVSMAPAKKNDTPIKALCVAHGFMCSALHVSVSLSK